MMYIETLVDYVVIKKTHVLTYDEKIEIIDKIMGLQEKLPELDKPILITALGLQTLSDRDLVIILHDTLFLHAAKFFFDLAK